MNRRSRTWRRSPSAGRCLDLPLQVQQIAAEAVRDPHAQFSELEKLFSKLVLPPEEEDGCKRSSQGDKREHNEYEFHSLSRMYLNPQPK